MMYLYSSFYLCSPMVKESLSEQEDKVQKSIKKEELLKRFTLPEMARNLQGNLNFSIKSCSGLQLQNKQLIKFSL